MKVTDDGRRLVSQPKCFNRYFSETIEGDWGKLAMRGESNKESSEDSGREGKNAVIRNELWTS